MTPKKKRAPSPRKAVAVKKPAAARSATGEYSRDFSCREQGTEPVMGAAYLFIDRAYVLVEPRAGGALRVTLRPKGARDARAVASLGEAFGAEYEAQKLRWSIARANQDIREYVIENALTLADEYAQRAKASAEPAPEPQLTDDQRSEIERLIAEVETEIKQMNEKKDPAQAKPAALSWEAAQKKAEPAE